MVNGSKTARPRARAGVRAVAILAVALCLGPAAVEATDPFRDALPGGSPFVSKRFVRSPDGQLAIDQRPLRVCPPIDTDTACTTRSLREAFEMVGHGETLVVAPGIYEEAAVLRSSRVTIAAEPGAHIKGVAAEGKGALVIKGDETVIENLECSGITVSSRNGACVRLEGDGLTLRNVHFHHSQMGILTGNRSTGTVLIEDSLIERNGIKGGSLGHNIYVGSGVLIVRRSRILESRNEGHEVKSRAFRTIIEDSIIASQDGRDSRLIDIPKGGDVVIRNNILVQGPKSSNHDAIGIGLELRGKTRYPMNRSVIHDNLIILERPGGNRLIQVRDVPPAQIHSNIIVGGKNPAPGRNRWYPDRQAAGLPAYPSLDLR